MNQCIVNRIAQYNSTENADEIRQIVKQVKNGTFADYYFNVWLIEDEQQYCWVCHERSDMNELTWIPLLDKVKKCIDSKTICDICLTTGVRRMLHQDITFTIQKNAVSRREKQLEKNSNIQFVLVCLMAITYTIGFFQMLSMR